MEKITVVPRSPSDHRAPLQGAGDLRRQLNQQEET